MRMDLTGPAQAVAPALAAILVGGDDAGHAASVAIPASTPAAAVRRARRGCNPDLRRPGLLARRLLIFGCRCRSPDNESPRRPPDRAMRQAGHGWPAADSNAALPAAPGHGPRLARSRSRTPPPH